jgi:tetratricopeptide (TPR) repeat protein
VAAVSCGSEAVEQRGRHLWIAEHGRPFAEAYPLCEQALRVDPNNVHALWILANKFQVAVSMGTSVDPKADLKRAEELLSQALALDPTSPGPLAIKAWVLNDQGRFEEAIAQRERALALDPTDAGTMQGMGWDYVNLGQYEKGLELFDKAIRFSPHDTTLQFMSFGKSWSYFGLKQYDQAIDWARRAITIGADNPFPHTLLTAALALTGHEAEAREALQHYLAMPSSAEFRTIGALKAYYAQPPNVNTDPRADETLERVYEGLRKAGLPET